MLIVHKYGGSSVATVEKIRAIAQHLKKLKEQDNDLVVVVSAMGKTTNELIALAHQITKEPSKRELDALTSTGELQTVSLLSIALNSIGVRAVSLSGSQAGIITSNHFTRAFIQKINNKKIKDYIKKGYIVLVAGFQGVTKEGDVATLGRGGSDTTAVALAASLKCPCEIYTDVEGVYTIDPRRYEKAKKLNVVSYDEMLEMAINGAKVLETRSVELAKVYNIKLYIGKTLESKKQGTFVMNKKFFEEMKITALAVKEDVCVVTLETPLTFSFQEELLNALSELFQNFELFYKIKTNNANILSLSGENAKEEVLNLMNANENFKKANVAVDDNLVRFSLIGTGLSTHKFFVKKTMKLLKENKIETQFLSLSETVISFTINKEDKVKAIEILGAEFEL